MESSIKRKFMRVDTSDIPQFEECHSIIHKALWVLWVGKDKLNIKKMTAEEISSILRDVNEVSIEPKKISLSLNRAGDRVHYYRENGKILYEIMKAGKDYLVSFKSNDTSEVFYFEPEQRYSSKRLLTKGILESLTGELKIADPYIGERTLDVIKDAKARPIKFLTRLDNLNNENAKRRFLRELNDFKTETVDIEFRDYPNTDLHDRYIISPNNIVLLGHSIKDLGSKESFAVVLTKTSYKNIYESLIEGFDRRWKQSNPL